MSEINDRYPKSVECHGESIELDLLESIDKDEAGAFTAGLTDHDLLSLSRDIQEPKVIDAWSRSIESGDIISVAARKNGVIVGTTAVLLDKYSWSAHVGELRILVGPEARNIGLGRVLIQESFLIGLDLGLEKLTVRMTLDQDNAVTVLEEMGFRTEALLRDHVKDRSGKKHDLLLMSHDVESVHAKLSVYGIDQAV